MSGLLLAGLAAAAVAMLVVLWLRAIERVEVQERLWALNATVALAIALAIGAFTQEPGVFGGVLAGASILLCLAFAGLGFLAPQSKQAPALALGSIGSVL